MMMKKNKLFKGLIAAISLASLLTGCGSNGKGVDDIMKKNLTLGISVHDPAVVEADGRYYIFGSHMAAAESDNLVDWKMFAEGVKASNKLFSNLFDDEKAAFAYVDKFTDGGYAVWAPDVFYNEKMGKWVMYFCTSHDFCTSNLCMAVADDVKGPYTYTDTLLYSGFTSTTVEKTNFYEICGEDANVRDYLAAGKYNHLKYPNCIDPNIVYDKDGNLWMIYGSWSGGIWILGVDEETGMFIHPTESDKQTDVYFGKRLIGGLHNSCEGPYVYYDETTDYYYMTVSYGELTREGGYQVRVFRAKDITGPFLDAKGETLEMAANHSEFGVKMMGNYMFPSLSKAYMAPGHNSVLQASSGDTFIVHHQRFDGGSEYHEPRVRKMYMTETGWPVASPFAYTKENIDLDSYSAKDVEGEWYFVNHGTDISSKIHEAIPVSLKGGKIKGMDNAGYELSIGTKYMAVTVKEVTYSGVVADMYDEAGNKTRCFMGVGDNNETLWGVMYLN